VPTDVFWFHTNIFTELFHAFWTNNVTLLGSCINKYTSVELFAKRSTLGEELHYKLLKKQLVNPQNSHVKSTYGYG